MSISERESGQRVGSRQPAPAERRPLTVVFCDLAGSTELSQRLDPEDLRDLIGIYHRICGKVVDRYEGYIAQYHGDGVLIYFGFPEACEDSSRRAVLAGLGIIQSMRENQVAFARMGAPDLAVRIGIHSGLVVVSKIGVGEVKELTAHGAVPNVAARLQSLAEKGAVVVSADVHRLVERHFECRSLGRHSLKGCVEAMEIFQVLRESQGRSANDSLRSKGLLPLVGRESERDRLKCVWRSVKQGSGRPVHLVGEPGIGKSRLAEEIQEIASSDGALVLIGQCSPYHQDSALYPVIHLLEGLLGLQREMPPEKKRKRIEAFLSRRRLDLRNGVSLLADLLGVLLEPHEGLKLSAERQRQMTAELIVDLLARELKEKPVLLVGEDLHWADPSTLALLDQILVALSQRNLMGVFTFRPGFVPAWQERALVFELERLPEMQSRTLIEQVAEKQRLPRQIVDQIIKKSDGIPLFVEEMTKATLENPLLMKSRGSETYDGLALEIPATLNDILMVRLDRLSHLKPVAQICSVLGRGFLFEMALALLEWNSERLREALRQLIDADLMFPVGEPPYAKYSFRHGLIQEAAYQSMLRSLRRSYHLRIAEAIPERFRDVANSQPGYVAEHFAAAGESAKAIAFWVKSGQMALRQSANLEAISQTRKGLAVLEKLAPSEEKQELELSLLSVLGIGLVATQGFGAREVGEVYARAIELWRELGSKPQYCEALWGMWAFYLVRSELEQSKDIARELLEIGLRSNDSSIEMEGRWTLGDSLFWLGDLPAAREQLDKAIAIYDPDQHRPNAFLYGQDPGVASYCYRSYVLWHQGLPDLAMESAGTAVALATKVQHPFSMGWALAFNTMLRVWSKEVEAALDFAEQTIRFASEQVQPFWLFAAMQFKGWALVRKGEFAAGLKLLDEGIQGYQAIGSITVQPFFIGLRAEAYGLAGHLEESIPQAEQGIKLAIESGQRILESALHRIHGELLLQRDPEARPQAAHCFQAAIASARAVQSPMLEQLAQACASQLRCAQGDCDLANV